MNTKELIKKVRRIEIKPKGLSSQIFSGEYHSAFKGKGMSFAEVREYSAGDEIRTIDWNVTARFNEPFVKVFEEERELSVMLIVDISGSENFGTQNQLKRELITEICAVLSFSATSNNDKVGLLLFSDKVEKFIPPRKGKSHTLRIIRELIEFKPTGKGTNIAEAMRFFTNTIKKRSIAFILSDFFDKNYLDSMKIANRKHDLVGIKIYDKRELSIPSMGWVKFLDPETGSSKWINTSRKRTRRRYETLAHNREQKITSQFKKSGIDIANIATNEPYIIPLMNLFKRR